MTLTALVVDLSGVEADVLSDALLDAGALSVSCEELRAPGSAPSLAEPGEPASWPRVRLTALCGTGRQARANLAARVRSLGVAMQPRVRGTRPGLGREIEKRVRPGRVSPRLWVVPSWHAPRPGRAEPAARPGPRVPEQGAHATTRLCLRWLERRIAGGETVLDYGCGSGILAIAALKLGAARAVGVDIDQDAVAAAAANARRNGVAGEFFESGSLPALAADIVVANILANPLKVLAPIIAERCRPGGRVALSGILAEQGADVEKAYAPWIAFAAPEEDEGWVCLSGVRQ